MRWSPTESSKRKEGGGGAGVVLKLALTNFTGLWCHSSHLWFPFEMWPQIDDHIEAIKYMLDSFDAEMEEINKK